MKWVWHTLFFSFFYYHQLDAQAIISEDVAALTDVELSSTYGFIHLSPGSEEEFTLSYIFKINGKDYTDSLKPEITRHGQTLRVVIDINSDKKFINKFLIAVDKNYQYFAGYNCRELDFQIICLVPDNISVYAHSTYGSIRAEQFPGKMKLSSTYGHVEYILKPQHQNDLQILSEFGFIDVSIPKSLNANLELFSQHGDYYSDLETIKLIPASTGDFLTGVFNAGSIALRLKSPYGNIYLRKAQY